MSSHTPCRIYAILIRPGFFYVLRLLSLVWCLALGVSQYRLAAYSLQVQFLAVKDGAFHETLTTADGADATRFHDQVRTRRAHTRVPARGEKV